MPPRRDRLYYRLLDALSAAGCPICFLLLEDGRRYLDSVLYERVTDVPTRDELRKSFGLCNLHTWQLTDIPMSTAADMGFAIIATDLLRNFEAFMRTRQAPSRGKLAGLYQALKRKFGRKLKRGTCPACRQTGGSESYHLEQLLDCLADEQFRSKYEDSPGICVPHFTLLPSQLRRHACFTILRETQLGKARALRSQLEQFIERQDHQSQDPLTTDHTNAWKYALEFLGGKPGAFGNELGSIRPHKLKR